MAEGNQLGSINHVVVLMLENRSFDHMLGHLYSHTGNVSPTTTQPYEGLTGSETNPGADKKPVAAFPVTPSPSAYFMPGADPGEGYVATNLQLFGSTTGPAPARPAGADRSAAPERNAGFVTNFATALTAVDAHRPIEAGTVASDIMGMFTPTMLPVLSGLARGFAVCDQWFASVPTETFPNRAFAGSATSQGHMDDSTSTYTSQSIFGLLGAHHLGWSIFGYDTPPLTRLNFPDTTDAPETHFGLFADFRAAAAAGTLAPYTFLEPSWGSSGNSQHPNYDVALGEQLIHDVYTAVRTSPTWAQTLLIIVYDEHGGCYDHVTPPSGATPPDRSAGEFGFDFTRFGVRVPAVLVSPLIAAGTVFRPTGPVPLDHTSILKTVETRWQLPALTARDAAAPDLGDVLTLSRARTDDPLAGVTVPVSTGPNPAAGTPSHIQRVHARLVANLPVADPHGPARTGVTARSSEQDYDTYIRSRTEQWRAGRPAS
jgi:phospholipase C